MRNNEFHFQLSGPRTVFRLLRLPLPNSVASQRARDAAAETEARSDVTLKGDGTADTDVTCDAVAQTISATDAEKTNAESSDSAAFENKSR